MEYNKPPTGSEGKRVLSSDHVCSAVQLNVYLTFDSMDKPYNCIFRGVAVFDFVQGCG